VLRFEFFVYKTDAENYTLHLQGAQFTLSEYDASSKSWKTLDAGLTTNGDGMFSFVGPDAQNEFAPGTLFELTETKAPEGYALSDKAILFCFGTGSQSDQEAIDSLKANGVPDDLADQAQVFDEDGGNLYIPNERLPLNVKKVWKDENGNVIDGTDAGVDAVTVRLYCSTSEDGADLRAADADAIVLDEANDWSGQWTNLPETDDDGNALWYFVKEEVPNGWKVSVDGQGSKAYGDIVIMNTKDVAVTIAATGGDASAMKMVAAGVLLATVGIVLFQNKRKNKR
jgi:LPXTG-motif cell wall-anchored protein